MTSPLPQYPAEFAQSGVEARICNIRLGFQPVLAGLKHLNRLENVLARAEWSDPAIAEGLLFDTEGNLIGGTMSNMFIVERSVMITPDLTRCGVAGVTRARLIQAAASHGMVCSTGQISQERLLQSDEILLVNTIIGVWQVKQVGDKVWMPGMVARHARKWLDEDGD
jgi:4-amino-4-deoxychorismate lyase